MDKEQHIVGNAPLLTMVVTKRARAPYGTT